MSAPTSSATASVPVVSGRAPCPCGSGRRYKACHGKAGGPVVAANPRPFAGRVDEADLVALRELVPSASAPLTLTAGGDRTILLGTTLPLALPAMVRASGTIVLGLQTAPRSDDLGRDLGHALEVALDTEPATNIDHLTHPGEGPRLTDLLDPARLDITVHPGFDWWFDDVDALDPDTRAALDDANAQVVPTTRLTSVEAAYWCRIGERTHLRWALPHDEEPLLDAFARLYTARAFDLGDGTKFVGAFRACGLVIPVWDLAPDAVADDVEEPAAALAVRLEEAYADRSALTTDQRRSRAGISSRQLTIR